MEKEKKEKKERKNQITFNYIEEFKTNIENPTEMDLKEIFNEKFYNYIKKKENRLFGGCNFE